MTMNRSFLRTGIQSRRPGPILILLALLAQTGIAGKGFKERIDILDRKCRIALQSEHSSREQKQLVSMICAAEALLLCAEMEQTPAVKDYLAKRSPQFHTGVTKLPTIGEQSFAAAIGVYNFAAAIASIRAGYSPLLTPIRNVETQALRIQQTDSLSPAMKGALIVSQSVKLFLIAAAAIDSNAEHRSEMKSLGSAFDAEARRIIDAADGLAISAHQAARAFIYYSALRFPGMKKAFDAISPPPKRPYKNLFDKTVAGFRALYEAAILHARRLDA